MAWTVQITDEAGRVLEETSCAGTYFAGGHPSKFRLLKYVDEVADTTFNHLQMADFLKDWAECEEVAQFQSTEGHWSAATHEEWLAIKKLAERVRDHGHLYLKFIGD